MLKPLVQAKRAKVLFNKFCLILTLAVRLGVAPQTRCWLKRPIAEFTGISDAQVNRLLVLAEILFDVKILFAVVALELRRLMVNHVSLEIAQRVEYLPALVAGNFLLRAVYVVDVIAQSRVTVEAFLAVRAFVLPLAVVNISWNYWRTLRENSKDFNLNLRMWLLRVSRSA